MRAGNKGQSATTLDVIQRQKKRLTKFIKTLDEVPTEILEREASNIEMEAFINTPYDTGKLENSVKCRVSRNKYKPGLNISASAKSDKGYDYAGIQHEREDFVHPRKGRDHYLSKPFENAIRRIKKEIRTGIRVEWRGYNG